MSTNIPRITQKIFAQNAAEDDLLQFGSVLSGNATPSTSIAETQTEAYQTGWRSAVISDRNYPTLGEMNAVQQVPTQQLAYLFQKGVPEWDASTTYFANVSYCQVNGVIYKSLTDNNIGNNPTTDSGTNWIIADFSNKLTNCILSAPNGVATYSGLNITVKQGLKVLIPNGRNDDKTLKNIEYAFDNDTIFKNTATLNDRISGVFIIPSTGEVFLPLARNIFSGLSANKSSLSVTMQTLYYATDENLWYEKTSSSDWEVINGILLGTCEIKSNNFISLFSYQPVSLAKEQDLDGNWTPKFLEVTTATAINRYTYDLSNYLPNDGNIYEVSCRIFASRNDNIGTNSIISVTSSFYGPVNNVLWCTVDGANFQQGGEAGQIIIDPDHKITYAISGYALHAAQLNLYAYRKVR